jgi:hypothetical protein
VENRDGTGRFDLTENSVGDFAPGWRPLKERY